MAFAFFSYSQAPKLLPSPAEKNATELATGDTSVHCVSRLSETKATNLEFLFRRRVSLVQLLFGSSWKQETVNSNRYLCVSCIDLYSLF